MKSFIFSIVLLVSSLGFANESQVSSWKSDYLPGFGKVKLSIKDGMATVIHNKNHCLLNAIGNPTVCSVVGVTPVEGKLNFSLEASGSFPRGTSIYYIEGTNYGFVTFKNMHAEWTRFVEYHPKSKLTAIFAVPLTTDDAQ